MWPARREITLFRPIYGYSVVLALNIKRLHTLQAA